MKFSLVVVACLQVFVSVAPSMATPLPLPLALMMADYSPSFIPANHSFPDLFMTWREIGLGSLPSHRRRDLESYSNLLALYNAAKSHAHSLSQSALPLMPLALLIHFQRDSPLNHHLLPPMTAIFRAIL
jgi:hypothetical protein